GLLRLGPYEERFVSHLVNWSRREYEARWRSALKRVLDHQPAALITDMWLPTQNSHLLWWPMWLVDSNVIFHNQLLFFEQHGVTEELNVLALYDLIGPRLSQDDEGTPISEWSVPAVEIKSFLNAVGEKYHQGH
ncbi:MAG: hypothetical protein ACM3SW_14475, partial [Actinomycetota bacterium]